MKFFSALIAAFTLCTGAALGSNVGFQRLTISNGQDKAISVGIWYPTDSAPAMTELETYTPTQVPASTWFDDRRIKAAVVAAPALGYTFGYSGLEHVQIPIQLWRAQADHILPHPYYAEAVHIALSRPPEYHVVPNADHFDFLAPCSEQLEKSAPVICSERAGFDRVAFHSQFNTDVVNFFRRTLLTADF